MKSTGAQHDGAESFLKVGEVALRAGKTVRALHFYEEMDLIRPARRTAGGFRLYDACVVERLAALDRLHDAGLSLPELRALSRRLAEAPSGARAACELRAVLEGELEALRERLASLRRLEGELAANVAFLEGCEHCERRPERQVCRACEDANRQGGVPDLVATLLPDRGAAEEVGP